MRTWEITEQECFQSHEACGISGTLRGNFHLVIQHSSRAMAPRGWGKESQAGGPCGGGFHAARNWLDQECNQLPELAKWGFTAQWISRLKENSHKYGISLSFFSRSSGSCDYFFPCKVKALTFWYIIEEGDCFQPLSEQSHGHHVHSPSKIIALRNATACGKIRASLHFTYCCDLTEVSGGFSGSCLDWFKDEPGPEHGCWPGCLYHILNLQVVTFSTLQKRMQMFKEVCTTGDNVELK